MKLYDKHFFHTMKLFDKHFSINKNTKNFCFEILCFIRNTNHGFFVITKPRVQLAVTTQINRIWSTRVVVHKN